MGALCAKDAKMTPDQLAAKARQDAANREINAREERDNALSKLLLLGAGESGKSTLFKQITSLYKTQEKDEEKQLLQNKKVVFQNIVTNAQALAEATETYGEPESEEAKDACANINNLEESAVITPEIAADIKTFWSDAGVQGCYDKRAQYQLNDSTAYFFEKLDEICQPGWLPSPDDYVRTRVRTTGIVEHKFEIDGNKFAMFDVGGQRNERKKWIHCFQDVTAVMFVAAISEYDQVLFEDYNTNRVQEALKLFADIVNSQWFRKTSFILFLNKEDLFIEKIKSVDITDSKCKELQAFDGDCRSYEETSEFMKQLFLSKQKIDLDDNANSKKVHAHFTCATDRKLVTKLFNDVKTIIVQGAMDDVTM